MDYLYRNGIDKYCDERTFVNAVERLRSFGLLKERPAPPPPPEPEPELLEETIQPTEPEDDGSEEGYDESTGEKIRKSAYQIRRMSAEQYLRWKRIPIITSGGPPIIR